MKTMQNIENLIADLRCASRLDTDTRAQAADLIERMAAWLEGNASARAALESSIANLAARSPKMLPATQSAWRTCVRAVW